MNAIRHLVLCLEGPLMSFGTVAVDEHGVTQAFPTQSMVTGLLSNALGYSHGDSALLQRLQERVRFGARRDRDGTHIVDFQTVDLGQDFLRGTWTTRHEPASRAGGTAKAATHIRYRHFMADAVYSVVLTLDPPDESPTLDQVAEALREPERPLFLGRKACLPSSPILAGELAAASIRDALVMVPLSERADGGDLTAWWPAHGERPPDEGQGHEITVTDERDWLNQIHVGRRFLWEGLLSRAEVNGGK